MATTASGGSGFHAVLAPTPLQGARSPMSSRSFLSGAQPPEPVSISTTALLILFILLVVGYAAYKDSKLATAIGAACAVGALLLVLLR